jgi:hypothetical protein
MEGAVCSSAQVRWTQDPPIEDAALVKDERRASHRPARPRTLRSAEPGHPTLSGARPQHRALDPGDVVSGGTLEGVSSARRNSSRNATASDRGTTNQVDADARFARWVAEIRYCVVRSRPPQPGGASPSVAVAPRVARKARPSSRPLRAPSAPKSAARSGVEASRRDPRRAGEERLLPEVPARGTEVVSWYVMMGIGQVVTLRFPAERLRDVNLALEQRRLGRVPHRLLPDLRLQADRRG